jgi:hypothetical protein
VSKHTAVATERWLPVPGWDTWYEVSDRGRVRSFPRSIVYDGRWGPTRRSWPAVTLRTMPLWDGHLRVNFVGAKRRSSPKVHLLVLEAFVGPRPEGALGCHKDDDPANNALINLYWGTHSENQLDSVRLGNHHEASKTHCPREHPLVMPNLVRYQHRRGYRSCLACARAYRPGCDVNSAAFRAVADAYYRELM